MASVFLSGFPVNQAQRKPSKGWPKRRGSVKASLSLANLLRNYRTPLFGVTGRGEGYGWPGHVCLLLMCSLKQPKTTVFAVLGVSCLALSPRSSQFLLASNSVVF